MMKIKLKKMMMKIRLNKTTLENNRVIVNLEDNLPIIPEKSENELETTSEEAIMTVNNEVVVHESTTIDE